eukprot:4333918-Alexandrium_andersonii.AAC.1
MLEEHGHTAGCLERSRVCERRPVAVARRSEECQARFEALLRAPGDARVARADARANEHLARRVQDGVEAAAVAAPRAAAALPSGAVAAP